MTNTEPTLPDAPVEPTTTAAPEPEPQPEVAEVAEAAETVAAPPEAAPSNELSPAACGAKLAELFPALFVAPNAPGPVKPIKLRIHTDIHARAPGVFTRRVLGIFFSRYTTTNAYLKALVAPGAQRFDLDGQPAGEIAEEHRAAAVEEIDRRRAIAIERHAAERNAFAAAAPTAPTTTTTPGPAADAPPRPAREERRPPRGPRPPDARGERPERGPRPQRPARADRPPHAPRPEQRPMPRADRPPQREVPAALPADPAQRERALLLRSFESSPLSKANFCALKRISEAELDAALAQARAERG
jgi:ProP effector